MMQPPVLVDVPRYVAQIIRVAVIRVREASISPFLSDHDGHKDFQEVQSVDLFREYKFSRRSKTTPMED